MKIFSLVDNIAGPGAPVESEHGLSLYIELDCGVRVLFDTGQGDLFARNARSLGIDLSSVDIAVISHGHYDHAGGLATFMELNSKAQVYIREAAFESHYSLKESGLKDIGVPFRPESLPFEDGHIRAGGRLVFCREVEHLPYGITLFSCPPDRFPEPPGNRFLLGPDAETRDSFHHEQSLLISEPVLGRGAGISHRTVLFGGCAHLGIANILNMAETLVHGHVSAVFSGMHVKSLFENVLSDTLPATDTSAVPYIGSLADELLSHQGVRYFTMHCTGLEAFHSLSTLMPDRISYLACGESVTLQA